MALLSNHQTFRSNLALLHNQVLSRAWKKKQVDRYATSKKYSCYAGFSIGGASAQVHTQMLSCRTTVSCIGMCVFQRTHWWYEYILQTSERQSIAHSWLLVRLRSRFRRQRWRWRSPDRVGVSLLRTCWSAVVLCLADQYRWYRLLAGWLSALLTSWLVGQPSTVIAVMGVVLSCWYIFGFIIYCVCVCVFCYCLRFDVPLALFGFYILYSYYDAPTLPMQYLSTFTSSCWLHTNTHTLTHR